MKQKFSVLLSVCDKDCYEYLSDCLESIWDYQNLKPNEIVIVKDGKLEDGMLTIKLERVIPEEKKPRLITIK